jgi:hypothetical protein
MRGDVEAATFPKGVHVITSRRGDRRAGPTAAGDPRGASISHPMAVSLHRGSFPRRAIGHRAWVAGHALSEFGFEVAASVHGQPVLARGLSFKQGEDLDDHTLLGGRGAPGAPAPIPRGPVQAVRRHRWQGS